MSDNPNPDAIQEYNAALDPMREPAKPRAPKRVVPVQYDLDGEARDVCPTCKQKFPAPGNTYCSTKCRQDAHRFRRRLDDTLLDLRRLGFDFSWQNGTTLYTSLPFNIRRFFVVAAQFFAWPDAWEDCRELGASEYFARLGYVMGEQLAAHTDHFSRAPHYPGSDPAGDYEKTIFKSLHVAGGGAHCRKCHRDFILSLENYPQLLESDHPDSTLLVCGDCLAEQPF